MNSYNDYFNPQILPSIQLIDKNHFHRLDKSLIIQKNNERESENQNLQQNFLNKIKKLQQQYGTHIQLKTIWKKFRTKSFQQNYQNSQAFNILNNKIGINHSFHQDLYDPNNNIGRKSSPFLETQKKYIRNFKFTQNNHSSLLIKDKKQEKTQKNSKNKSLDFIDKKDKDKSKSKQKQLNIHPNILAKENKIQKIFNKTQTDLQHNFTGKKYLKKIEEQKKKIKTQATLKQTIKQSKILSMSKTNLLKHSDQNQKLLKKNFIASNQTFKIKPYIMNKANHEANSTINKAEFIVDKKILKKGKLTKKFHIHHKSFYRKNKFQKQIQAGPSQTAKKLLRISNQLNDAHQKNFSNKQFQNQNIVNNYKSHQQKLKFKKLIENIQIQPWQKSNLDYQLPIDIYIRKKY